MCVHWKGIQLLKHSASLEPDTGSNRQKTKADSSRIKTLSPLSFPKLFHETENGMVAFPLIHGPYGEDGSLQGLLKLTNTPFVGSGVLGSAVSMDKEIMKRLLKEAQIPIAKFLVFHKKDKRIRFF